MERPRKYEAREKAPSIDDALRKFAAMIDQYYENKIEVQMWIVRTRVGYGLMEVGISQATSEDQTTVVYDVNRTKERLSNNGWIIVGHVHNHPGRKATVSSSADKRSLAAAKKHFGSHVMGYIYTAGRFIKYNP